MNDTTAALVRAVLDSTTTSMDPAFQLGIGIIVGGAVAALALASSVVGRAMQKVSCGKSGQTRARMAPIPTGAVALGILVAVPSAAYYGVRDHYWSSPAVREQVSQRSAVRLEACSRLDAGISSGRVKSLDEGVVDALVSACGWPRLETASKADGSAVRLARVQTRDGWRHFSIDR